MPVARVLIRVRNRPARERCRTALLSCAQVRGRRRTQRGASDRNRADRFRQCGNYFSRGPDDPRTNIRMWNAGSRQRRHRILHGVQLRRYQGELTGYSFQIRLFICGALRERHQHSRVLLLRRLNILQCRADNGIRYRDGNRLMWRLCSEAVEIRQREIRHREAIKIRQRDIREREVIKIRQRIGHRRANDDHGE
jgi:hypothetical protein